MPLRLPSRLHTEPVDPVVAARVSALSTSRGSPGPGWTPQARIDQVGLPEATTAELATTPRAGSAEEPRQGSGRLPSRPHGITHHTLTAPGATVTAPPGPPGWLPGAPAALHGQTRLGPSAVPAPGRVLFPSAGPSSPWRPATAPVNDAITGSAAAEAAPTGRPAPPVHRAAIVSYVPPEDDVPPPPVGPSDRDVASALRQDLPLDLGLEARTSVLEGWKTGRTDPGRRGVVALAVLAAAAVLLTAFFVLRGRPEAVSVPEITTAGVPVGETAVPEPTGDIVVSVGGKVARPGVVTLPAGARVDDALTAAGGPTEPEGAGLLNLARPLVDGEQVLVGVEPPPGAEPGPAGVAGDGLVDLNAADASAFEQLSGIGPVLAERIVAWREEHGRFTSVDQLREVSGIGEAKFASVKDAVRV